MAHKRRLPRNFDFTFQSGSIQIKRNLLRLQHSILYIPIWFYSNLEGKEIVRPFYPLHSNLVLFKSKQKRLYYFSF